MKNDSAKIFCSHLEILLTSAKTYRILASTLGISESCIKSWLTKQRVPKLRSLDKIADVIGCYTFELIREGVILNRNIIGNNSHAVFCRNLKSYFIEKHCFSLPQKLMLLNGQISEFTLNSYFRSDNYKLPTLSRLDMIADSLDIYTYKLLFKEEETNEEGNFSQK